MVVNSLINRETVAVSNWVISAITSIKLTKKALPKPEGPIIEQKVNCY
jgi:hypothetical protein